MIENYEILENGVIRQKKIRKEIRKYNKEYIDESYNKYGIKGHQMAGLRLGYLVDKIGRIPNEILDVGYGNGDFLNLCKYTIKNTFGHDITDYPLPKGVKFIDNIFSKKFDVVCFFDVLEHFEDISFVKKINCNYIYISVPWCHNFSDEWFLNWKHRREDEHLWHFNKESLEKFFIEMGYTLLCSTNIEDLIRTNNSSYENILTCIFKKNNN